MSKTALLTHEVKFLRCIIVLCVIPARDDLLKGVVDFVKINHWM
nr:hypothetical protein [Azospirillum argentinense]